MIIGPVVRSTGHLVDVSHVLLWSNYCQLKVLCMDNLLCKRFVTAVMSLAVEIQTACKKY